MSPDHPAPPRASAHRLLSPAMQQLLGRIQKARRARFEDLTVAQVRALYESAAEVLDFPRAPLPRVEDHTVAAADGVALPVRLYAPRAAGNGPPLPVLLYLHGGGFTIGSLDTHDSLCRQLALRAGVAVVSLAYRLAPEHPFPQAVNDAWAALQHLATHAGDWGLNPTHLAVGGDSAGATLATVCALYARDAGLPLRLQLLITPGTAPHAQTPSRQTFADGFLLDESTIEWFFGHYVQPAQREDWRFAPLLAEDLEGVAPACILVAECDPLVDEGLAYADRLRLAGVPVELELARGVVHDFIKMGRALAEADRAQAFCAAALRAALFSEANHNP